MDGEKMSVAGILVLYLVSVCRQEGTGDLLDKYLKKQDNRYRFLKFHRGNILIRIIRYTSEIRCRPNDKC